MSASDSGNQNNQSVGEAAAQKNQSLLNTLVSKNEERFLEESAINFVRLKDEQLAEKMRSRLNVRIICMWECDPRYHKMR
jgi:hypothetical protein